MNIDNPPKKRSAKKKTFFLRRKMNESYKLAIPLELIFKNYVEPMEWPLRICVSVSGNMQLSDREPDILITDSFSKKVQSSGELQKTHAVDSDGTKCFCLKTMVCAKYQKKSTENHSVSKKSAVVVSVFCSTKNELGRRCWRNGGSCHFLLAELAVGNNGAELWKPYVLRRIVNNAYNVKSNDRLTGLMGARLGEATEELFDKFSKKPCWKSCFLLSAPSSKDVDLKFDRTPVLKVKCWKRQNEPIAVDRTENPLGLFLENDCKQNLLTKVVQPTEKCDARNFTFFKELCKTDPLYKFRTPDATFYESNVYESREKYKRLLDYQDKIVLDWDDRSKKMKCPWTPMDVSLSKFMSDYKTERLLLENPLETQFGARFFDVASFIGNEQNRSSDFSTEGSTVWSEFDSETVFVTSETDYAKISCNYGATTSDKRRDMPNCVPDAEYLPFFAFIMHPPLRASKSFWGDALSIMVERSLVDEETYACKFFQMSPSERAGEAFQMICNYSQCLEYISDFYTTCDKSPNGKIIKRKRCVEQFSNCLRNWGGDCEDLSQGHYQIYTLFVEGSEKSEKHDCAINSHPVLKEMRRVLRHNYVIFLTIEGVFLPKQSYEDAGPEESVDRSGDRKDFSFAEKCDPKLSQKNYLEDTKNLNSAHAAIKLLPKKYFEACVNRSSWGFPNGAIFEKTEHPTSTDCCFYHRYAPDAHNDDLPVLFGEGTSMLVCRNGSKDSLNEKWLRSYLMSDEVLVDRLKTPIYCKNGLSSFYRSTFFGSCNSFLESKKIATFSFARLCFVENAKPQKTKIAIFLRGATHKQLSFKDDAVALVPYGNNPSKCGANIDLRPSNSCKSVNFYGKEMNRDLLSLCKMECDNRIPGRKISSAKKRVVVSYLPENGCRYYEPFRDDSEAPGDSNGLRARMTKILQSLVPQTGNTHFRKNGGYFHVFFDNAYASEKLCERIAMVLKVGIEDKMQKTGKSYGLSFSLKLEKPSGDLSIWRLTLEMGNYSREKKIARSVVK